MDKNTSPNILIWRNGKLGNTIVAIPFILELRKALPRCRISVIVESLGAELLSHYPEINELILYEKRKAHKSFFAHLSFVRSLRSKKFTHAFIVKRFFRNSLLSFLAGIPNRFGFAAGSGGFLLTGTVPYSETRNVVQTNLSLLSLLDLPIPEEPAYRFYSSEPDRQQADRFLLEKGLTSKRYAVIHCGGETVGGHNVSPDIFAGMAKVFIKTLGVVPVFLNCRGDEAAVKAVEAVIDSTVPYVLFPDSNIRVNGELLRQASFFAGANSGQAHLAALTGTPSLVLYQKNAMTLSFIQKWLPWQKNVVAQVVEGGQAAETVGDEVMDKIKGLIQK